MNKNRIRVGITMGDPSGIGPAIAAKALRSLKGEAEFTMIGDSWVFRKAGGAGTDAVFIDLKNVPQERFEFGRIKPGYGRASMEYLDAGLQLIKDHEIDCLVTCPISKEAIQKAGYRYSGHTEYLAKRSGCRDPVMMLLNSRLRLSLVTRHIPLAAVPQALNAATLRKTILTTFKALKELFFLPRPRIVVCGLNPHASDNGVIGREENRVIKPQLQKLRRIIKVLDGPLAADIAVSKAHKGHYDAVIAMYHDQALIPLKLSLVNDGVNMTLGLPFIRTSPLHGTAFDIARTPQAADPRSMIEAIRLSIKCASNQRKA